MRTLSPIDAFTPALERTKAMLLPFSFKRGLKLGLVALLAEMSTQLFLPPVGNYFPSHSASSAEPAAITHQAAIVFTIIGITFFAVGLVLLYFGSRLQMVFMEMVATRATRVRSSWRSQSSKTWRWIVLKITCLLVTFVVIGSVIAIPIIHFIHALPSNPQQPPDAAFVGNFFLFFVTVAFAVLLFMLTIWTLRDFVLPFIVFENSTIKTALRSAATLIGREPRSILFYFLMKVVFTMVAGLAAELCLFAAAIIAAIPLSLIAGLIWLVLHRTESLNTVLLHISFGALGMTFLICMLITGICAGGAVLIFSQAYTLYFLGGRIPLLGDLLEPPPPPLPQMASSPSLAT